MKVGDLVTSYDSNIASEDIWLGIIIDIVDRPNQPWGWPIVYWNEIYFAEKEYPEQIKIVQENENESR